MFETDKKDSADAVRSADSIATTGSPLPGKPTTSAVPGVASTIAPADVLREVPSAVDALIEEWFQRHFHGLGSHLTEYLHAKLHAAKEELKTLLVKHTVS